MGAIRFIVVMSLATATTGCKPPPLPPRVALHVINNGDTPICGIFIRQSKHFAAGWGTDWMDRTERLEAGLTRSFQLEPHKTWDLRIEDCSGVEVGSASKQSWSKSTNVRVNQLERQGIR